MQLISTKQYCKDITYLKQTICQGYSLSQAILQGYNLSQRKNFATMQLMSTKQYCKDIYLSQTNNIPRIQLI